MDGQPMSNTAVPSLPSSGLHVPAVLLGEPGRLWRPLCYRPPLLPIPQHPVGTHSLPGESHSPARRDGLHAGTSDTSSGNRATRIDRRRDEAVEGGCGGV